MYELKRMVIWKRERRMTKLNTGLLALKKKQIIVVVGYVRLLLFLHIANKHECASMRNLAQSSVDKNCWVNERCDPFWRMFDMKTALCMAVWWWVCVHCIDIDYIFSFSLQHSKNLGKVFNFWSSIVLLLLFNFSCQSRNLFSLGGSRGL